MSRIIFLRIFIRVLAGIGMLESLPQAKALPAIVMNPTEWTKLSEDVQIFCATKDQPIKDCYWEKSSAVTFEREFTLKINSRNEIEERPAEGNYAFAYYNKKQGNGLEQGYCGLSVKNISSFQIGLWGCTLIGETEGPWVGSVNVPLLEKPSKPYFKDPEISETLNHENGTTTVKGNAKCCVNNGNPEEEIKFEVYFDGVRIPDSHLTLDSHNSTSRNNRSSLCIKWDFYLSSEDDGKQLMCNVTHRGYSIDDERSAHTTMRVKGHPMFVMHNKTDHSNTSTPLVVSYSPTNELQLHFCIKSNPDLDQIKISRNLIPNGEKSGELSYGEEFLKENEEYSLNSTIQDKDLSICYDVKILKENQGNESTHYIYFVLAHNALGFAKSGVSVVVSPPEGSDPEQTAWTLIVIGIIMSLVFILIIIGVLNCTAKRRGWWCYKNRTQKYPVAKRSTNKPRQFVQAGGIQHSLTVVSSPSSEYSIVSNKDNTNS